MVLAKKTATYGKSARRPVSNFSAFADASEQITESVRHSIETSQEATTQNTSQTLGRRSESPEKIVLTSKVRRIQTKGRAELRIAVAQKVTDQYEFSAAEEVYEHELSAEAGSRKKRRLTPTNGLSLASKVSNDDDLQRYIATAYYGDDTIIGRPGVPVAKKSNVATTHGHNGQDRHIVEVGVPTTISADSPRPVLSKKDKPRVLVAREKSVSRQQEQRKAPSKDTFHKVWNDRGSLTRPGRMSAPNQTSDCLTKASTPDRDESQWSDGEDLLPVTPPRLPNASGITTTPKQQELWQKLLADTSSEKGLEYLNLDSQNVDRERQDQGGIEKSIRLRKERQHAHARPGKRPMKLIDSLMSSAQDGSVPERDYNEDLCNTGAEQTSSSQPDSMTSAAITIMRTSPSIDQQGERHQIEDHDIPSVHQPVPSTKGMPKVTYIRERTHLGENHSDDTAMLDMHLMNRTGTSNDTKWRKAGESQNANKMPHKELEDLDEAEDHQEGPMRNIHELREAGGNSRLAGELDAILDDLEELAGSSKATRRSSLLTLASRLLEASTCRMFVDQSLDFRLLDQLKGSHDVIERSLLAASILQIVFNTSPTVFLSEANYGRTTNLLIGLLDQTQDLSSQVKLRENKISRMAQTELITFYVACLRLPVWRALKPPVLSGQVLALQCLKLLALHAQETASRSANLSLDALSRVAETSIPLQVEIHAQPAYSMICLELAISILESSTKSETASDLDAEWTETALERITGVFPALNEESSLETGSLQSLTLRLYLNLTNTIPRLCEPFSELQILRAVCQTMFLQFDLLSAPQDQRQDLHVLEKLVLSLGYMINLAESSDEMRLKMMELEVKDQKALRILLQLFSKRKKAAEALSEAEAENNVAFGYLSVLLGYLCLNRIVREHVNSRLEGPTVSILLDALEEFLQYHQQIDERTQRGEKGKDRKVNFIGRLKVLIEELRIYA